MNNSETYKYRSMIKKLEQELDRRNAEIEEMRTTLERLKGMESIINRSPAMVILWGLREGWPVDLVSKNIEEILGYTVDDLISGKVSWPDITHQEDVPRLEQEVSQHLFEKRTEFDQEYRLITKSGAVRWMREHNRILYDAHDVPTHIQSIVMDITDMKMIEEAYQQSEEKYRELVENINDVVYLLNEQGVYTYVSPSAKTLCGYEPWEIIGRSLGDMIHAEDLPLARRQFKRILDGTSEQFEFRVLRKTGTYHWVLCSGKPKYSGGRIVGVQGVCADISERKKVEEELRKARRELEVKSRNLEETNTALKVLLKHQDEDKKTIERNFITGLRNLVMPYIEKLRLDIASESDRTYLNIIESNLTEITKPFMSYLSGYHDILTPTEIQIINLIRENKSTKEIANILCSSEMTVFFHRRNIRDKLDLRNKKTNLRSFLQSFDEI